MTKDDIDDDEVRLRYGLVHMLFKKYNKKHNDPRLAFAKAIIETANASIKDNEALAKWKEKYSKKEGKVK